MKSISLFSTKLRCITALLFLSALIACLTGCANIIPPTGGPRDEQAPKLKKASPAIGTTNFKGGKVMIEFDEEIELDNNPNNIIISPIIDGQIQLKDKKKKYLEITIPSNLKENTTYSISLNNVVKDVTESNKLNNITYAFSTGPLLDSLTLSGQVVHIESKQPVKNILLGLYEKSDTLNTSKQKPLYITYADEKGSFLFKYLKKGTYLLIALEDKNKNLLFDNQEKVDFLTDLIIPNTTTSPLQIELSTSDTSGNKLLSKKPSPYKLALTYRNGIKNYSYKASNAAHHLDIFQEKRKAKELTVYASPFEGDSLFFLLSTADSLGNKLIDTLAIPNQKKEYKKEYGAVVLETKQLPPGQTTILFKVSKPIKSINTDSLLINLKSTGYEVKRSLNGDSLSLTLSKDVLIEDSTKIEFRKGSVVFYDRDTLQPTKFVVTKADPSSFSVLEMKIKTKEKNYLIQLLSEDYTILEEFKNITILQYPYIKSGTYRIRAIVDKNGNGHWDRANFVSREKAEPIFYYNNDKLVLKPNWELKDLMFIF